MTIANWLFGTCGRSHIGIYVCSRCGYELVRSGFERNLVLNLQRLLPFPMTVDAAKGYQSNNSSNNANGVVERKLQSSTSRIVSSTPFNDSMLKDFTENANLARTWHKNSLVMKILRPDGQDDPTLTNFEISCGKCGSSLGHQLQFAAGQTKFIIKNDRVDLTFRTA